MSRSLPKRGVERRKKPRGKRSKASQKHSAPEQASTRPMTKEACAHCGKDLNEADRALFVEEENGRLFCNEECIASYFTPEIERLEKEYLRHVQDGDLKPEEREQFAYLRWVTLEEPDEVWREKTLVGDFRYTMISEFRPSEFPVWCVCICLMLRGEPSFLYLAFTSKKEELIDYYRRGERVQWRRGEAEASAKKADPKPEEVPEEENRNPNIIRAMTDGLADAWTEDETLRAQITRKRRSDDIPQQEFSSYQEFFQQTLEEPDEIWTTRLGKKGESKLYHFMKRYTKESPEFWYVIVARELENEEQMEVLDAFPTRDPEMVQEYRRGEREIGGDELRLTSNRRVVH